MPGGNTAALAGLIRVIQRAHHVTDIAGRFAVWRNDIGFEEIMSSAMLHDLTEMLVRMLDDSHADNPRVRKVMLAVNIARHSMHGWDNAVLPDDFAEAAQLLSTTPEKVADLIRPEEAHAA